MTLSFVDRTISSDGYPLLTGIAATVSAETDELGHGLFLNARAETSSSRLMFNLGSMPKLERFTACHRWEPYWMKPRAGTALRHVPPETQSLIAELENGNWLLLVPLLAETFRFSLRGKKDDTFELLAETSDSFLPGVGGLALFLATGSDPFQLVQNGARSVAARLKATLRRDKPVPDFIDYFGWCTWDAFYTEVSAEKVLHGLSTFAQGGVNPRFLILDDGWQSTVRRPTGEWRLTSLEANDKFPGGLRPLVAAAKRDFGVQVFLCWHAMSGYWGGVDGERLPAYGVIDQTRQFGEGILFHAPTFNQDWWGSLVGYVPTEHIGRFYDDYHELLREQGVDGVKVDQQAVLESVSQKQGGRIAVSKAYREALETSVDRHFGGRLLNCMSNAQETFYSSPGSTLLRTSVDFLPRHPETHGAHLYINAQVGVWFGEFMHPDWDMFQSAHALGRFHAAGRVVSGGPVYVSDTPGAHDFELLEALVCSDGSVLRCDGIGLPTLDTLCHDPTSEDILLKIWNRNGRAGFVGAFNARYAAEGSAKTLRSHVGPADVPQLNGREFACYSCNGQKLFKLGPDEQTSVELAEGTFELFTLVPIERGFAPVGLADKLNSAGAIARFNWTADDACEIALRDGGTFLAYSEREPQTVRVDGERAAVAFDAREQRLSVKLERQGRQSLTIEW